MVSTTENSAREIGFHLAHVGNLDHVSDVRRPHVFQNLLRHNRSCRAQSQRVHFECALFDIEELFLGDPFVCIQGREPIQNMGRQLFDLKTSGTRRRRQGRATFVSHHLEKPFIRHVFIVC